MTKELTSAVPFEDWLDLANELNNHKKRIVQLIELNKGLKELLRQRDKDNADLNSAIDKIMDICKNGVYDKYHMPLDELYFIEDIIKELRKHE